jgi:hypothetical protein
MHAFFDTEPGRAHMAAYDIRRRDRSAEIAVEALARWSSFWDK